MEADKPSATKTRILEAALTLFNAEGVSALSAVDIAAALGISPGHLYYHFKGKPEILAALVGAYQGEVELVLAAAVEACGRDDVSLETVWTHVHILVEEAWDARFLYREAGGLVLRYPELAAPIRRIAAGEREAVRQMLTALAAKGVITATPAMIDGLSHIAATSIGFHALQLVLEGDTGPPRIRVARAAAQLVQLIAAFARP